MKKITLVVFAVLSFQVVFGQQWLTHTSNSDWICYQLMGQPPAPASPPGTQWYDDNTQLNWGTSAGQGTANSTAFNDIISSSRYVGFTPEPPTFTTSNNLVWHPNSNSLEAYFKLVISLTEQDLSGCMNYRLVYDCDDTAIVYVNGVEIDKTGFPHNSWGNTDITSELHCGENIIAIYCKQLVSQRFLVAQLFAENLVNVDASFEVAGCTNSTLELSATEHTGATYSWTGPGFTANTREPVIQNAQHPTNSGDYNVTVSFPDRPCCEINDVVSVDLEPFEAFDFEIESDQEDCVFPVTLSYVNVSGDGEENSWLWSSTETSQSIQISEPGTYSLTLNYGDNCELTKQIVVEEVFCDQCLDYKDDAVVYFKEHYHPAKNLKFISSRISGDHIYSLSQVGDGTTNKFLLSKSNKYGQIEVSKIFEVELDNYRFMKFADLDLVNGKIFVAGIVQHHSTYQHIKPYIRALALLIDENWEIEWTKEVYTSDAVYNEIGCLAKRMNGSTQDGWILAGSLGKRSISLAPNDVHVITNQIPWFVTLDFSGNVDISKAYDIVSHPPPTGNTFISTWQRFKDITEQIDPSQLDGYAFIIEDIQSVQHDHDPVPPVKTTFTDERFAALILDRNGNAMGSNQVKYHSLHESRIVPLKILARMNQSQAEIYVSGFSRVPSSGFRSGLIVKLDGTLMPSPSFFETPAYVEYFNDMLFEGQDLYVRNRYDLIQFNSNLAVQNVSHIGIAGPISNLVHQTIGSSFHKFSTGNGEFVFSGSSYAQNTNGYLNAMFSKNVVGTCQESSAVSLNSINSTFEEYPFVSQTYTPVVSDLTVSVVSLDIYTDCCNDFQLLEDDCHFYADFDVAYVCPDQIVISNTTIEDNTSPVSQIQWSIGAYSASGYNPTVNNVAVGNYDVCVTVTLEDGCDYTICKSLSVGPEIENVNLSSCHNIYSYTPPDCDSYNSYKLIDPDPNDNEPFNYNSLTNGSGCPGWITHDLIPDTYTFEFFDNNGCLQKILNVTFEIEDPITYTKNIYICHEGPDACVTIDVNSSGFLCSPNTGLMSGFYTGMGQQQNVNGVSSVMVCAPDAGPYSLTTTMADGCTCTVEGNIIIKTDCVEPPGEAAPSDSMLLSVQKKIELGSKEIWVFPNPSTGLLRMEVGEEHTGIYDVKIFDNTGRFVKEVQTAIPGTIDLSTLSEGIYHLRINGQNIRTHSRVLLISEH